MLRRLHQVGKRVTERILAAGPQQPDPLRIAESIIQRFEANQVPSHASHYALRRATEQSLRGFRRRL